MENNSREKLNIELFGLPGVGKSYLLDNLGKKYNKKVAKIEKGFNVNKILNILYGIFIVRLKIFLLILKKSKRNKEAIKLFLVLLERIGRSKRIKNVIFDEGILQAIWGLFLRIGYDEKIMKEILNNKKICINHIIYVFISKKNHLKLLQNREYGFKFKNQEDYIKGRNILKEILCNYKQRSKNERRFSFYNNTIV